MTDRRTERERLVIKRDPDANAAYLKLTDTAPGDAVETVRVYDHAGDWIGAVDLDADGCVLGIEFLDAARRLPRPPAPP